MQKDTLEHYCIKHLALKIHRKSWKQIKRCYIAWEILHKI